MKQIQIGDNKDSDVVLLCRVDGKLYCVSANCPHMNIHLESGHLYDDRIYSPPHQTSFSIKDGYPDTGMVQDKLNTFEVWEENGKIYVLVPECQALEGYVNDFF